MFVLHICCVPSLAHEKIGVDIWVEIINGGTVEIITEVNCPLPDKSQITVNNGEKDKFHIDFCDPGDYTYTVKVVKDGRNIFYDNTVYQVKCYVREKDGSLSITTIVYNIKTGNKYEKPDSHGLVIIGFTNHMEDSSETYTVPPENSENTNKNTLETTSAQPSQSSSSSFGSNSRPKTGDDNMLDLYLFICIIASAGLFILSIVYLKATNDIINEVPRIQR